MPYIDRKDGQIRGYASNPMEAWGDEFLADDAPELLAFLTSQEDTPSDKRRRAYAGESDPLVIRAMRLQMAGDPGFEAAKKEALAKVAEIKARLPDLEAK